MCLSGYTMLRELRHKVALSEGKIPKTTKWKNLLPVLSVSNCLIK